MTLVRVLRGLPASGKTTWTLQRIHRAPTGRIARINNDDLIASIYPTNQPGIRIPGITDFLTQTRLDLLHRLLNLDIDEIIIDNTNLHTGTVLGLEHATVEHGATFIVDDRFLRTPIDVCIARDQTRTHPVGEQVIRKMARQATRLTPWQHSAQPFPPITQNPELPGCVIFDIDGTLAHKHPDRDIYDGTLAHLDTPDEHVTRYARHLIAGGEVDVVIVTGRDARHRDITEQWVATHITPGLPLFTRAAGDNRRDSIIKREILERDILPNWYVHHAIDDRKQVTHMWRQSGIPCWHVAEGDF